MSAKKNKPQYIESMAVEMEMHSRSNKASLKNGRLDAVSTRNNIKIRRIIRA